MMSDRDIEARYRAKIAARANGTTKVVVFPAGSGGVDDRYQAKVEARKLGAVSAQEPEAEPEKDPPKEPAKPERRSKRDE